MGRILLVCRLALRDLRRRRTETALLLLAVTVASATLTLGLTLRDAAVDPFRSTREATSGPDVVAAVTPYASVLPTGAQEPAIDRPADLPALDDLTRRPDVIDHSGPYPVVPGQLRTSDRTADVQAVGRGTAPAAVDQPQVNEGTWVSDGGVVVEAAFAAALGLDVGDPVTVNGRSFDVVGIAVTTAMPPYPESICLAAQGCMSGGTAEAPADPALPEAILRDPGLIWLAERDLRSLVTDPYLLSYVVNLRLGEPSDARAFAAATAGQGMAGPVVVPWQDVEQEATRLARDAQILVLAGASLLALLAVASLSMLVAGRMTDQSRRVGLLKAVGAMPGFVAVVLLAEYLVVTVVAAAAGLALGAFAAPLLTDFTPGLVGGAGAPPVTVSTVGVVTGVAVAIAAVATFLPAVRAARTSTVSALNDAPRTPRRTSWLVRSSARLPVPLLLALRIAGRRPRRTVLAMLSVAVTVSGVFVALMVHASSGALAQARSDFLGRVLLVVMLMVLALAAVNAVFIAWTTVLDNRHASALARALGATSGQVSAGLTAAQVIPALVGALLGVLPGGYAMFVAVLAFSGGDSDRATFPPGWQVVGVVLAAVLVVTLLTAVPARLGGRRSVAALLRAGDG